MSKIWRALAVAAVLCPLCLPLGCDDDRKSQSNDYDSRIPRMKAEADALKAAARGSTTTQPTGPALPPPASQPVDGAPITPPGP